MDRIDQTPEWAALERHAAARAMPTCASCSRPIPGAVSG